METTLLQLSYNLDSIGEAAQKFWTIAPQYTTVAFSGDMGAGKTTFIHHVCDLLKVEDAVSSPTFALVNEYHFKDNTDADRIIYHMDWYRLKDTEEALHAGLEDCLIQAIKKEAWCFIEWPEKAEDLLYAPYLWVSIKATDQYEREMDIVLIGKD